MARVILIAALMAATAGAESLRIALFDADVTPPAGTPLCGSSVPPAQGVSDPLSARGIVLLGDAQPPIVLCAVDWTGIANASHDAWRSGLAKAAGTTPDRVAVHCLHQHDAPAADATTDALLKPHGMGGLIYDPRFDAEARARTAKAAADALAGARPVTAIGTGMAKVEQVASNRRILGPDGTVRAIRWSATTDPAVRAEPEGVIDPYVRALSFWNGETPLAVLTFYATHPQSFYRTGFVSADFPGLARNARQTATGIPHIHFNGAAGNITAGKYNDGSPANRPVLAARLEAGMRDAFAATQRSPASGLAWRVESVALPRRAEIDPARERARLENPALSQGERMQAAFELAYHERAATPTELPLLALGPARVAGMPGELFVEYQLAAQQMAPGAFVCMAAYGDYGAGYIGTAGSYPQGGYETGLYTSRTAPEAEAALTNALKRLLAP